VARSLSYRLLACLLAITSGLAVPGTALAHGFDHHSAQAAGDHRHADHHEAEHDDHDDHDSVSDEHASSSHAPASDHEPGLHELPAGGGSEHSHPCLERARSNRVECPMFVLIALTVAIAIDPLEATPPPLEIETESRPRALTHAPPPPSRAPPTTLG
jgi:hypothetical protein